MATSKEPVRFAVVGLGYIAQAAVLPAFEHAKNVELAALISDDPKKLKELGRKYKVEDLFSYNEYEQCLRSGIIDAVYIALPNSMHAAYTIQAARAGVHVLCEKPMAVTEKECVEMINACRKNDVRLMIAYRLHFEKANLKAKSIVESGKLGETRFFNSEFAMQVKEGDIRLRGDLGGGTLYDIGIYAINAARSLFAAEPIEVSAFTESSSDPRFSEVEEIASCLLRFPGNRLASITCSFGTKDVSMYEIVGTKGRLRLDPAYELADDLRHHLTTNGSTKEQVFPKRDQFAPELEYFAECVRSGNDPQPSGVEGLADVTIIRALYKSAKTGRPVKLEVQETPKRPDEKRERTKPPVERPKLVNAEPPSE